MRNRLAWRAEFGCRGRVCAGLEKKKYRVVKATTTSKTMRYGNET